jgi:hypothetical protein
MTSTCRTRVIALAAACGFAVSCFGCASEAKKPTAQERQDRALKDPFGYKPEWNDTSVSGGGTADLDKDGLRKDLKNVLDP